MAANLFLFFPTIVSGGGNFGVLRKPWKTDQAVSVYSWTEERQTSLCHHCRILYFSHTHLYLPIVIVFIRLSDLPDSSLALWRKQLFQIVLCVMSKNVFCKCTKIFFILCVCVCVQRGCCPNLVFLEINTMLDSKDCELPVYIQALQMACPKLKVKM